MRRMSNGCQKEKEQKTIRIDISGFKGISEIGHRGIYGYGFYPGRIKGEGFFISVVRKKEKPTGKVLSSKIDSNTRISREELRIASELFDTGADDLIRYHDEIIALPCNNDDYGSISEVLKIVKAGTRLFKTGYPLRGA